MTTPLPSPPPTPKTRITIRRALPTDAAAIAKIYISAFANDVLFHCMYPRAQEFPEDRLLHDTLRYTDYILNPALIVLVAEVEDGEVGGFCCVERYAEGRKVGPEGSGEVREWGRCGGSGALQVLERSLFSVQTKLIEMVKKDRSYDPAGWAKTLGSLERSAKEIFVGEYADRWYIKLIGVSPNHQRKGVAKKLLAWAMERATRENLPLTLEASQAGRPVYTRMGFQTIAELEDFPGGAPCMVWRAQPAESTMKSETYVNGGL
ncbi:acyl-CoA N-acyltransferase [Ascobolus immersus RN42]|uniref:Acyl-CoA N-acyltransferase n=1 Tax=Ascobolus immersus RN42 TaxID=1160509 RepID=A0A3N4HS85_ASCIM|nr:acyl-CoA N-acyltransferase [Ascobolus immersus RN42]